MKTANGMFTYTDTFIGKTLHSHIINVHNILAKKCNWGAGIINKGAFGYDNIAMSIGYIFKYCPDKLNKECLCEFAHDGWATNYAYWRDNKPWLTNSSYKKPGKPLGDSRRNKLALMEYADLPKEEKITNIIIAEYILDIIPTIS